MGSHDSGQEIFLANQNNLIVERNYKYMLIDPRKKVIIGEFKIEISLDKVISLNDKIFLGSNGKKIKQCQIKNNKIELIEEKKIKNDLIIKYPDNKLMICYDKNISIYG